MCRSVCVIYISGWQQPFFCCCCYLVGSTDYSILKTQQLNGKHDKICISVIIVQSSLYKFICITWLAAIMDECVEMLISAVGTISMWCNTLQIEWTAQHKTSQHTTAHHSTTKSNSQISNNFSCLLFTEYVCCVLCLQ